MQDYILALINEINVLVVRVNVPQSIVQPHSPLALASISNPRGCFFLHYSPHPQPQTPSYSYSSLAFSSTYSTGFWYLYTIQSLVYSPRHPTFLTLFLTLSLPHSTLLRPHHILGRLQAR